MKRTVGAVMRTATMVLLLGGGCGSEGGGTGGNAAAGDAGNGDGGSVAAGDGGNAVDSGAGVGDGGGAVDSGGGGGVGDGGGGGNGVKCERDPNAVPTWRVLNLPIEGLGVANINQQGPVAKGFTGVAYGNGVWVASVNSQGENVIRWARSTDGEHWEARSTPVPAGTTYTTSRIHYALGKFVYFGELMGQGVYVFTSSDGQDFAVTKISDGRLVLDEFAFSDTLAIIAGHDSDMRTSTNLTTWTGTKGIGEGTYTYVDIAYGNGLFLTSVNGWGHVYSSVDGVTWKTIEGLQSSAGYFVEYGNGIWLAASQGAIFKSTNGADFEQVTLSASNGSGKPRYAGDRFVGFDVVYSEALQDKFVAVATLDGVNWSPFGETMVAVPQGTINISYGAADLAYGNCKYVVAGSYGPTVAGATEQDPVTRPVLPLIIVGDVSRK